MIDTIPRARAALFALSIVIAAPGMAHAQAQAARQACRSDYSKFCTGTAPGGGRILACLQSHADQLSTECKDALKGPAPK
jgi:hypothetical protein